MGIKSEPCGSIHANRKETGSERKPQAQILTQEKRLVETIVTLKKENQLVHFQLNEKNAELAKLNIQFEQKEQHIRELDDAIVAISSNLRSAELKAVELHNNFFKKQQCDQKVIDGLNAEKKILTARMKQFQSGALINLTNMKDKSEDENVYEVEHLIDDKLVGKIRYYRVRWRDYGPDNDTWERAENLLCPSILQEYLDLKSEQK